MDAKQSPYNNTSTLFSAQLINSFSAIFLAFLLISCLFSCSNDVSISEEGNINLSSNEASPNSMGVMAAFTKLAVKPPLNNVAVAAQELVVKNPNTASTFTLPSGTVLNIPQNAFIDKNGTTINSPVQIKYREFTNPAEIISSGIPMRVLDKNKKDDWMQTAGMFEIRGFQGTEEVLLAEGKSVEVNYASEEAGTYDFWYFDEAEGNWLQQGSTDDSNQKQILDVTMKDEGDGIKNKTLIKPVAPPTDDNSNRLTFTDLDVSSIPELKGKTSVILVYNGTNPKLAPDNNAWISEPGKWLKKEIKALDKPRTYQLTLYGDSKYSIPVRLPLQEAEIKAAQTNYEKQLAQYNKDLAQMKDRSKLIEGRNQFIRTMRVANFGIYNHDILYKREDALPLLADFDFGEMNEALKEEIVVYLITGDNRVVVSFPKHNWENFRFSPSDDNKLIAILPDNKTAIFSQSNFNKDLDKMKSAKGDKFVFAMETQNQYVDSPGDISSLLAMADE